MMDFLIGLLSAVLTIIAFRLIHNKTKLPKQYLLYYFLLCIFGAFILLPQENILFFVLFSLLGYVCLEDFHQSSVVIAIPVFVALFVFFFDGKEQSLLFIGGFFILFILWDFLWSRFISEKTDILFLFPLLLFPFSDKTEWLAYGVFLFIVLLARLTKEAFIGEGDAFFALPLLLFIEGDAYITLFMFALFIALPFALASNSKQKGLDEFPFTPFLLGGYILARSEEPLIPLSALCLSIIVSIWLKLRKRKKNRE